jgi:hypothetical protein
MEDRRRAKRYAFSATAEVVEMMTGARLSTRAADLSEKGCYLDSLNPFTIGTNMRIRIGWEGAELECAATVRDVLPGMGMGVAFTDLNDEQKALIANWIEKLDSPGQAGLSQSSPLENAKPAPPSDEKDALAVRLIDLMQKKGMLSAYEVASLLRDRNL